MFLDARCYTAKMKDEDEACHTQAWMLITCFITFLFAKAAASGKRRVSADCTSIVVPRKGNDDDFDDPDSPFLHIRRRGSG